MLVSSSVRLTCATVRNGKLIRSSLDRLLKRYVILSPKRKPFNHRGLYLCSSRQCSTKFVSCDSEDNEIDESKYMYQKLSRKENVDRLMECTGCTESLANTMLKEFPRLRYISSIEITRKMKFLNEIGVSSENILNNYFLISLQNDEIEQKLAIIAKLGVGNNNLAAPLLQFPLKRLKDISRWALETVEPNETRISYLSSKLKCDPAEIALAVSVHKFLQTVPFFRVRTILDILLDEGVPPSHILRDLWVVRYNVEQVKRRVRHAKEGGVEQFKTWMVRSTEKILNNTIRIQAEKRALLAPHNDSTLRYISSRLNVNEAEAKMIFSRQPQLKGVGAAKLNNAFNFLLGEGAKDSEKTTSDGGDDVVAKFNQLQVWSSSRVLCHSLETMKSRLTCLRALGYEPKNPVILYKSKRKFEEFVEKLKEKQALAEKSGEMENQPGINKMSESSQTDGSR